MNVRELAQEYNIKKKHVEDLKKELFQKETMIETVYDSEKDLLRVGMHSGKCIGKILQNIYVGTSEDVACPYFEYSYCINFNKSKEAHDCKGCKGYENYVIYRKARDEYCVASQDLDEYPFVVKFVAFFQRKK